MTQQTNWLFTFAAVIELLTGLSLVLVPLFVLHLVVGAATDPAGVEVTRLAGIALFCLGLLCWFSRTSPDPLPGLVAMLAYNAFVAVFFLYLGLTGYSGLLLWPVMLLHGILAVLFVRALRGR